MRIFWDTSVLISWSIQLETALITRDTDRLYYCRRIKQWMIGWIRQCMFNQSIKQSIETISGDSDGSLGHFTISFSRWSFIGWRIKENRWWNILSLIRKKWLKKKRSLTKTGFGCSISSLKRWRNILGFGSLIGKNESYMMAEDIDYNS